MFQYLFLNSLPRNSKLFEDCIIKLSNYDPNWSRERILHFINNVGYDCFICADTEDANNMLAAIAFNPDNQEKIAKVFLIYVVEKLRGQGMGTSFVNKFIIWALKNDFNGAQIGLGNNDGAVGVLRSIDRQKKQLFRKYVSYIEIKPETGVVTFKLS